MQEKYELQSPTTPAHLRSTKAFVYARYMLKHLVSFGIFGVLCVIYICCLPGILALCCGNYPRFVALNHRITHRAFRFVVWFCRLVRFIDMRVYPEATAELSPILVCNHLSMFDIVTIFCYFPGCYTFVNKKFLKNPLLYPIIFACGYIPLDHQNHSERAAAMAKAEDLLRQGKRLVVFPEGRRSRDGSLGPFYNGAFYLASRLKVAITPIFFTCDRAFLNNESMFRANLKPVQLFAYVMPPIPYVQHGSDRGSMARLKEQTIGSYRQWMASDIALPWNRL